MLRSAPMDSVLRKSLIQESFDTIAEGYDHPALRFFRLGAEQLVDALALQGHETVLDLATGTGSAALAAARVLPKGQVLGVDFSRAMLEQARAKAWRAGIRNACFEFHDLDDLRFPAQSFDAVSYAFGLFFMPDMAATLSQVASLVKPGGRLALCSFATHSFSPLVNCYAAQLAARGVHGFEPVWQRLGSAQQIGAVFVDAGLPLPITTCHDMGHRLADAEQWWDIVWNSGLRGMLQTFSEPELAEFKQQHLREIDTLRRRDGIGLSVTVLCSVVAL